MIVDPHLGVASKESSHYYDCMVFVLLVCITVMLTLNSTFIVLKPSFPPELMINSAVTEFHSLSINMRYLQNTIDMTVTQKPIKYFDSCE